MPVRSFWLLLLARCKFLHTPVREEVLANGRGVAGGCKSGKSHKQGQRADAQKTDRRLTSDLL
ncbi:MAG: hypothetical protein KBB29_04625 [Bacteroidales bacterium]|jgi:hypothetical protein|nr:hypothetical protein [Bacteroidales bacterium]HOC36572.1 hypothetical protein [Tenuifilaceae bacterium]MBP8643576.1 hypothetical protein [Bacteroidales bacterium]HOG72659.1 hypothetical protein [Tenuifilaceae bacterium]HPH00879.1 hypothetical protein [Tenuifilaceae bacterium]